ncbi:MAG TPA: Arc family DNA-binding protein [Solirubrobacteraceae bacterium]
MAPGTTLPAKRDAPKYLLRIPPELNKRLRRLADQQGESLNSLILMLLASSVGFNFDQGDDEPVKHHRGEVSFPDCEVPTTLTLRDSDGPTIPGGPRKEQR